MKSLLFAGLHTVKNPVIIIVIKVENRTTKKISTKHNTIAKRGRL